MKKNLILFITLALGIGTASASVIDSTKAVPVKGATNFRDLGGYETRQGTHVKWGKLYRSGEISKLTDTDLLLLQQKHIDFIVDFRGNDEVEKAKDKLPKSAQYLQLPAGSENLTNWMLQLTKLNAADSLMESSYSQTSHLKAKYQPFFQTLLKQPEGSALLFHCTAGKDRTGIGAALLLYTLGVPEETIIEDYLLSNEFRKEENEKMTAAMVKMGIKEQVAKDLLTVKPEYLMAAYKAIISKYGDMDTFLHTEMGLSNADIDALRKKYTN